MKSLHIFRAGTHTDQAGTTVTLSEADIAASAAAYDPAKHEAPIVVGHPRTDGPAYGWVSSVTAAGGDLTAQPHQVDTAFAEMVEKGHFKKISTSFYAPTSPSNPVPGIWYVKHVGFLGAQPPAIKGLRPVAFAEGESGVVEFSDWSTGVVASLMRRIRDWFLAEKGQEVADQVVPHYEVEALHEQARSASAAQPSPAFAEPTRAPVGAAAPNLEHSTVTPEEAARISADNLRLRKEAADRAAADRNAKSVAFAEEQITAGRLAPKHKDAVVAFLNFAETPAGDGNVVSFGEGDARQPLAAAFRAFVGEQPKVVSFGEQASNPRASTTTATASPLQANAEARATAAGQR